MVRVAEARPAADGANRTVMSTDLPATTVMGRVSETTVNPAALLAIELTVKSADPVLLKLSVASLIWPVLTLPKSSDAGMTEIEGASPPAAPVPLRATVTVG